METLISVNKSTLTLVAPLLTSTLQFLLDWQDDTGIHALKDAVLLQQFMGSMHVFIKLQV